MGDTGFRQFESGPEVKKQAISSKCLPYSYLCRRWGIPIFLDRAAMDPLESRKTKTHRTRESGHGSG